MNTKLDLSQKFISRTYLMMALALIISALTAYLPLLNPSFLQWVLSPGTYILLFVIEIVLVIVINAASKKMSAALSTFCLMLFAAVNGLTFTSLFLYYDLASMSQVFLASAGFFVLLSAFGTMTKFNLNKVGSVGLIGLLAVILCGVVNIFLRNSMFDLIITSVTLLIFVGLAMYDAQKVKQASLLVQSEKLLNQLSVTMALSLYLDFINIFISLLRLFAKKSNN